MSTPGLYLKNKKTGILEPATLLCDISDSQIEDWELRWKPYRDALIKRLEQDGVPKEAWPQSHHWNWPKKVLVLGSQLTTRAFSVTCCGTTQGMMLADLVQHKACIESQKGLDLVYVEYLETAPWNWNHPLAPPPDFGGVGPVLLSAAVQLSLEEGLKCRVGLHALHQAKDFYSSCGMQDLGPDPNYHNLNYFEFTPTAANAFLR